MVWYHHDQEKGHALVSIHHINLKLSPEFGLQYHGTNHFYKGGTMCWLNIYSGWKPTYLTSVFSLRFIAARWYYANGFCGC
jgi:hypothetical protein